MENITKVINKLVLEEKILAPFMGPTDSWPTALFSEDSDGNKVADVIETYFLRNAPESPVTVTERTNNGKLELWFEFLKNEENSFTVPIQPGCPTIVRGFSIL